jgi:hypothetical protein
LHVNVERLKAELDKQSAATEEARKRGTLDGARFVFGLMKEQLELKDESNSELWALHKDLSKFTDETVQYIGVLEGVFQVIGDALHDDEEGWSTTEKSSAVLMRIAMILIAFQGDQSQVPQVGKAYFAPEIDGGVWRIKTLGPGTAEAIARRFNTAVVDGPAPTAAPPIGVLPAKESE